MAASPAKEEQKSPKESGFRICVIGAGASGLLAVKCLQEQGFTDIVAYESKPFSAGVWNYIEDCNSADSTPMYKQLTTDIPFEIMILPDYSIADFTKDLAKSGKDNDEMKETKEIKFDEFVSHSVIKDYLNCYQNHFNISKYIEYNTKVVNIKELKNEINNKKLHKWQVTIEKQKSKNDKNDKNEKKENLETKIEIFDSVIVCNGHYNTHIIPTFEGLNSTKIPYMHSYFYRDCLTINKDIFLKHKRILLVGNGPSGRDIISQIYEQCDNIQQLYHVSRIGLWHMQYYKDMKNWDFDNKYILKSGILKFEGNNSVIFEDNTKVDNIDFILFCTGYQYDYKFIDNGTFIINKDNNDNDNGLGFKCNGVSVGNLYNYLYYCNNPSLIFIGLPALTVPFLISYFQSKLVSLFLKSIKLNDDKLFNKLLLCDNKDEKMLIEQSKKKYSGTKLDFTMNVAQFDYMEMICKLIYGHEKDGDKLNHLLKLIEERKVIWVTRVAGRWMPKQWPVSKWGPIPAFAKAFYENNKQSSNDK